MPEYYNVTTNLGDAELANAIATNTKLDITHVAFGDGNGSVPTPNKTRTSLLREVHRQAVTKYERHATNANWIVIETIIPSDVGGFTIREMGIIANGKLISHGSHAPFEKVADPSGVSEYRLRFTQNVTDGSVVELTLDESLIYATQAWIDENYIKRSEIVDNLTTDDANKVASARTVKELNDSKLSKLDFDDAYKYMPIPYPKLIPPSGFLVMMGQDIVESIHPKLFALYGSKLPDMRAYMIRGLDNGRGIDVNRVILSEQMDDVKSHGHTTVTKDAENSVGGYAAGGGVDSESAITGVFGGLETRVKNIAFLYIVKAG